MPRQRKEPSIDIPIGIVSKPPIAKRKLEDCEPGAAREEVLQFIEKVATSPRPSQKHGKSPAPTSS